MGKLRDISPPRKHPAKKQKKVPPSKSPKLTPEWQARLDAFNAVIKMRDEQWAAMTPQEQAEELVKWEKVKATINEGRAANRQAFIDE